MYRCATGANMQQQIVSPFDDKGLVAANRVDEKSDDFWTMNHMKLLYLISKYSHCAQTVHEVGRCKLKAVDP